MYNILFDGVCVHIFKLKERERAAVCSEAAVMAEALDFLINVYMFIDSACT